MKPRLYLRPNPNPILLKLVLLKGNWYKGKRILMNHQGSWLVIAMGICILPQLIFQFVHQWDALRINLVVVALKLISLNCRTDAVLAANVSQGYPKREFIFIALMAVSDEASSESKF